MSDSARVAGVARTLRTLYLVRAGVSVLWVVLAFALLARVTAGSPATVAVWVLLVAYPVWDAVATVVDLRAARATSSPVAQLLNIVVDLLAAIAIAVLLGFGLPAAIVAFGVWASLTGAVQLGLAIRRQRSVRGQWPMMISGGLSVLAGVFFAVMAASPAFALTTFAGYSAFGAFWYLVGGLWLIRSVRRASAA